MKNHNPYPRDEDNSYYKNDNKRQMLVAFSVVD